MKGVGGARQQARLQLEAQLHYKLGDFAAAISLYGELFRDHKARHAAGRPCRGFSDGPSDGPTDGPSDGAAVSLLMGLLSDGTEDKARLLQPDGASPLENRRQPNV